MGTIQTQTQIMHWGGCLMRLNHRWWVLKTLGKTHTTDPARCQKHPLTRHWRMQRVRRATWMLSFCGKWGDLVGLLSWLKSSARIGHRYRYGTLDDWLNGWIKILWNGNETCWHRLLQSFINPTLRKCGSSYEQGVANMFEKKGVILTSLKTGASLDDAESDGIEVP